VDHTTPDFWIEILEELLLLVDEVVCDPRAKAAAALRGIQDSRSAVLSVSGGYDVPLLGQRRDDAARGALVEEEPAGERTEAHRAVFGERFERVTLRHRNVVAADPIAIAKLVDTNQVRDGGLEGLGVSIQCGFRLCCRSHHSCQ